MAELDKLPYEAMSKQQLIDELQLLHSSAAGAEDGLRACEKRHSEIFDNLPAGIWIEDWSAAKTMLDDLAGQVVEDFRGYFQEHPDALIALYKRIPTNFISDGVVDMYGASSVEMLLDRWDELTTDGELGGFLDAILSFLAGETSFEYEVEEMKFDGTPVYVNTRTKILPCEEDDWSRVVISTMDISKRKTTEIALVESEALLSAFFHHSPNAISLKDITGHYFLLNPAYERIFGISNDKAKGRTSHDMFDSSFADLIIAHASAVLERGDAIESEHQLMAEDSLRTFLVFKFPLRDASGNINGIGSISADISELKRAEHVYIEARESAEMANRSKSEFLANMSHELRTPLNAIIGFSHIMSAELLGPVGSSKYLEYAKDINLSGVHLLELINDILNISKIETGQAELSEERCDVVKAVQSCLTLVNQRADQGNVEIHSNLDENLPEMVLDLRKFKQILTNLLSNAIKFTPPNGSISIKGWSSPGDGCVFQVTDTGIGIALADIPKVLAPFQQIDSAPNRKYEGTGLGLSLSKALVEMHGGSLGLESEIGVGTTVTVRFPRERVVIEEMIATA
jgi:PAS domain S-box-containing protein